MRREKFSRTITQFCCFYCFENIKNKSSRRIKMTDDQKFLVPMDEYLKAGIHICTKFKTKQMEQFIYKARPDGLFVLNLQKIDERLAICASFISRYEQKDIIIASRRENSWK